jgi:hypothetical protein
MSFVSPDPEGRQEEVAMVGLSRAAILTRYRHLRAIGVRHHDGALGFLSRAALREHARHLGLTLVAESMEELTLAFDLAVHTAKPGHSRAIDRDARATRLQPGSDEFVVLEAMRQARFSVWRVERRHAVAGLIVQDLPRQGEVWLVDEALEQSAPEGVSLAMRLGTPDQFAMTSGIIVPVDREMMTELLDEVLPRVRGTPDQVADDRRFATAIYRVAAAEGLMEQIGFAETPASGECCGPPFRPDLAKLQLSAKMKAGIWRSR